MKIISRFNQKLQQLQELRKKHKQKKGAPKDKKALFHKEKVERQILQIEVSVSTVIKVLLVVAVFMALGRIFLELKSVLIMGLISFFLAMGLSPILDAIEKKSIPRPLAILILYAGFLGGLGILFVKVIPILGEQLAQIASDLRHFFVRDGLSGIPFLEVAMDRLEFDPAEIQKFLAQNLSSVSRNLQNVAGSTFTILSNVFQGVFNFIFTLVLLFFILMEREQVGHFFLVLFPSKDRKYVMEKSHSVQKKMAEWFRGQLILMIAMGLFMYAGMKIFEFTFGMKYAATIGLLAGFMELFPFVGVLITGLLAGLIALNISWMLLLAVVIWIAIAQFLEGNVLVPMVMERVIGLSSVVTILALSIGGVLGYAVGGVALSIIGIIFSVPVAASLAIFVEEYTSKNED